MEKICKHGIFSNDTPQNGRASGLFQFTFWVYCIKHLSVDVREARKKLIFCQDFPAITSSALGTPNKL